ncbi:MAG TPA: amidase family protein, partial [Myxococcota bacterium]|nr:amidase family protein [Myxococcota bacterium]
MHELLTVSAGELARRIRAGEVTSAEVVETHIARVREVNPRLNAVVAERFDAARAEAAAADRRLAAAGPDRVPPFHGVPFTIKENFSTPGLP